MGLWGGGGGGREQVGAKEGNQSGGRTVTLLVLPLNGFWLGFKRQRLGASPIGELEQDLSMEKVLAHPPSRRVGELMESYKPRLCSLPRITMAE